MPEKLTLEDGQKALTDHAAERGLEIHSKYGPIIDLPTLERILVDPDCVRFPVSLSYSADIEDGLFAVTDQVSETPSDGYVITLHESFRTTPDDVPALVLYHLVTVNYGDFATAADAEVFGAACLGMNREAYYKLVCDLADSIA